MSDRSDTLLGEQKSSFLYLISLEQLASLLNMSEDSVMEAVKRGELPYPITIGRKRFWHPVDLDDFLRKRAREGWELKSDTPSSI